MRRNTPRGGQKRRPELSTPRGALQLTPEISQETDEAPRAPRRDRHGSLSVLSPSLGTSVLSTSGRQEGGSTTGLINHTCPYDGEKERRNPSGVCEVFIPSAPSTPPSPTTSTRNNTSPTATTSKGPEPPLLQMARTWCGMRDSVTVLGETGSHSSDSTRFPNRSQITNSYRHVALQHT